MSIRGLLVFASLLSLTLNSWADDAVEVEGFKDLKFGMSELEVCVNTTILAAACGEQSSSHGEAWGFHIDRGYDLKGLTAFGFYVSSISAVGDPLTGLFRITTRVNRSVDEVGPVVSEALGGSYETWLSGGFREELETFDSRTYWVKASNGPAIQVTGEIAEEETIIIFLTEVAAAKQYRELGMYRAITNESPDLKDF